MGYLGGKSFNEKFVRSDHEPEVLIAYVKSITTIKISHASRVDYSCSASHPYIGASPDGIINCDCCGLDIMAILHMNGGS